jgi:hypothetical protein
MKWPAEGGATSYNVYRGALGPTFDLSTTACLSSEVNSPAEDVTEPEVGRGFFYIITSVVNGSEGSPGTGTDGADRELPVNCP